MDGAMTDRYRTIDVPVTGGDLRVGIWDAASADAPTVLLIHGVTSSHLAWQHLAAAMPGVRLIAPDLRGRGRSNELAGPAGMRAHAEDLVAVLDRLGLDRVLVVGHSMGAFVAVVLAARRPERVARLVLVDGGLPLDVPPGLSAEEVVAAILGPTAARLSMRFADVPAYLDFWRAHPAFADHWTPELERYLAYDLVADGDEVRPATSYRTTVDDTVDLHGGRDLVDALSALAHPTLFVTVPRGLQDEEPGLYAAARVPGLLAGRDGIEHVRIDGLNHYTVVMSAEGAGRIAPLLVSQLAQA